MISRFASRGLIGAAICAWLIVLGCVIKVFAQIELGRHAVTHGQTTLSALNSVPGPRWRLNWNGAWRAICRLASTT